MRIVWSSCTFLEDVQRPASTTCCFSICNIISPEFCKKKKKKKIEKGQRRDIHDAQYWMLADTFTPSGWMQNTYYFRPNCREHKVFPVVKKTYYYTNSGRYRDIMLSKWTLTKVCLMWTSLKHHFISLSHQVNFHQLTLKMCWYYPASWICKNTT